MALHTGTPLETKDGLYIPVLSNTCPVGNAGVEKRLELLIRYSVRGFVLSELDSP